ncbi:MAG: hypothetical protein HY963_07930 [Ignavibacteriales bacterium]|nr:hypothetical protein [Ignavibacteriales bacterium]
MYAVEDAISRDPHDKLGSVIRLIDHYLESEYECEDGKIVKPYEFYIGSTSQDYRMRASKHGAEYVN